MANLIGKNFTPPDVIGKVTGKAKYVEDIHVDGLVYARLADQPVPHAKVKSLDVTDALAMDGVVGILTADDVPPAEVPRPAILTNNPVFVGDPILAIAAINDTIATNALEKVKIEYEPLPFPSIHCTRWSRTGLMPAPREMSMHRLASATRQPGRNKSNGRPSNWMHF